MTPSDHLSGSIEAIVFTQPENGFTVAKLKEPRKKEVTVIVGYLPSLQPGETVSCKGSWKTHPTHGRQFVVEDYSVDLPSDLMGIQKYLESGLVKGIGPAYAKKIVDHFGPKTLEVIEERPDELLQVAGLGEKRVESLKKSWREQRSVREVMIFLRSHGASPAYAQRIFRAYGERSIEKVKENPYQLAKEVFGIGFKMADAVAQKLGFALHSEERLSAGIEHVLWELTNEGHTCYPIAELLPLIQGKLEVELGLIEKRVEALVEKGTLVFDRVEEVPMIWLGPFYGYEQGIAKDLKRLQEKPQAIRAIQVEKAADWAEEKLRIRFAEQQRQAVIEALRQKVHIITGGPGTGKSTITNAILAVSRKLTDAILLAAPTGRAAKRMTQITGYKAFTLHALLEVNFTEGGFKRCRENPLDCDLLIVDEASMIDTPLLFHLLRAIPDHARLLLVGDVDQLPSVGPGMVLKDLLESEQVGKTRLTEIFRQAKGSKIITNAHRINEGEFPDLYTPKQSDFHFIEAEEPELIRQAILELVTRQIPEEWGLHPIEEVQVLSPMKKGMIGCEMLNETLQLTLNPSERPLYRGGHRFHLGDKVMQISNNYDKKVYNGDIGRISKVDMAEESIAVLFDDREIPYDFSELDELVLAYATSVHKYQGSECPCVVIPIHTSHFKLLYRNLLYTAVTRGKKQVYLVGSKKALAIAVHNNQVQKRYTGLKKALRNPGAGRKMLDLGQLELGI